jgi:hypothetical protein
VYSEHCRDLIEGVDPMTKFQLNIGMVVYVAIIVSILSISPIFKQVNRTGFHIFGLPPLEFLIISSAVLLAAGFAIWYMADARNENQEKNEWNERGR